MENMKFTQLSTSEFKIECVPDFCLFSNNNNSMVLIGITNEISILELMKSCRTMLLMPYSNKQISIPQHKPISDIVRDIDFITIYETGSVQESQELALDIIYTADCAVEPLKARVLQAEILSRNDRNICGILTNFGYCEIYEKIRVTGEWEALNTNLSNILITDIFHTKVSPNLIRTFNDLKTYTNKFIITSFTMTNHNKDMIIYLGTAAGYVCALKYDEINNRFKTYCHLKTSLNRICYITVYNDLMLVSCDQGTIRLLKINFESKCFQELEYLWSKSDRMVCRKAIFSYNDDLKSYLLVFSKAAHIMVYCLDLNGSLLCSSSHYVSGIKITGIESITQNEYIITTITGATKYIKISYNTNEELNIEAQLIDHEFDSANYQILGLATTTSKNLWSFVLYRNKEYVHQSKFSNTSVFLNVCKLNTEDSFLKLINLNIKNMNMTQDLIMAINLDIFNNRDIDRYVNYLDLEKLQFPKEINDAFLQKLQIKLIFVRKFADYQNFKYRKIREHTSKELQILEPVLTLLHILSRLQYLKQFITKDIKLSKFQELSIVCMLAKFSYTLDALKAIKNVENVENPPKTVDNFVKFITDEFEKYKIDTHKFTKQIEMCTICNMPINEFLKCEQEHEIRRCSISFTQLTLFETKNCPYCNALARNDEDAKLQELFAADDSILCIYCRFLLINVDY